MSIFSELYPNGFSVAGDPALDICKAICALADEVRAQREQDAEFFEADSLAAEEDAERRAQANQALLAQIQQNMQAAIGAIAPPIGYSDQVNFCECGHPVMNHDDKGRCLMGVCECQRQEPQEKKQ